MKKFAIVGFLVLGLLLSHHTLVFAHQPKLVDSSRIVVNDPEISKAYYGELLGQPNIFLISATESFDLYVNVLVPAVLGQKKDVSAVVLKNGKEIAKLDGMNYTWREFYEPFGGDDYFMGPEFRARGEAGEYEIRVWSSKNDSKYALAIGEKEDISLVETLRVMPKIKRDFFDKSFMFSPIGLGIIFIIILVLGSVFFWVKRKKKY